MADDPPDDVLAQAAPMRDARERFVQRSAFWLLLVAALGAASVSLLHWLDPHAHPLNRIVAPGMSLVYAALAWRQWAHPERMVQTMWISWSMLMVGIAAPVVGFVVLALRTGEPLVVLLPPVAPVFLSAMFVMTLFARPREALWAIGVAWTAVALPVLAYLLAHPAEFWTPRGQDLVVGFGPAALFVPLVIPLLRGVERRFQALHREGERLQALAERDVLIGLYNRRAGERFLSTLLAHARDDATLVLFDIDHFKRINDRHGHPVGDAVLIEVGRRCSTQLRADDIFARWGGEEFLVVLPGIAVADGAARAERLRRAICAEPIAPAGEVSASFGVTAIRAGDTLAEVVQRADEALYRAKANGRNRVEAAPGP